MGIETIGQLFLATLLGALIGLEREIKRKEAGLQTCSLVALAACLFTLTAFFLVKFKIISDPSPIFIAIAVGMGFIGAGVIFREENQVQGLTTAAALWTTAAIGLAVGAKLYFLATFTTFLVLLVLVGFGLLEKRVLKK